MVLQTQLVKTNTDLAMALPVVTSLSRCRPVSIPYQFMWDLWRAKWHWGSFLYKYFEFSPSLSF
jgi:hypothetical protein